MKRPPLTILEALLILLVFVVWLSLFTSSVVKETRLERRYVLGNTGTPVAVYVWEQGKGYRLPTREEEEYDLDRGEEEQE